MKKQEYISRYGEQAYRNLLEKNKEKYRTNKAYFKRMVKRSQDKMRDKHNLKVRTGERKEDRIKFKYQKNGVLFIHFRGYAEQSVDERRTRYKHKQYLKGLLNDCRFIITVDNLTSRKGWFIHDTEIYLRYTQRLPEWMEQDITWELKSPIFAVSAVETDLNQQVPDRPKKAQQSEDLMGLRGSR